MLTFGEVSLGNTSLAVFENRVLIDTGSSYTVLPQRDFATVVSQMRKDSGIEFDTLNEQKIFTCTDEQVANLSPLLFKIENITYTLPVSAYLKRHLSLGLCDLLLMTAGNSMQKWVLGLNFLHGYYTVLDADQK